MVSTDYTKPTINSSKYSKSIPTTDVLLLEGGDELLLENDTDSILLEYLVTNSANYVKPSVVSTDYS
jgi:hypothetical protein